MLVRPKKHPRGSGRPTTVAGLITRSILLMVCTGLIEALVGTAVADIRCLGVETLAGMQLLLRCVFLSPHGSGLSMDPDGGIHALSVVLLDELAIRTSSDVCSSGSAPYSRIARVVFDGRSSTWLLQNQLWIHSDIRSSQW